MRTKFKDAKDLLDYAEECRVASDKALRAYTEANQAWRAVGGLVARLVLPEDTREAEPKAEWIIELTSRKYPRRFVGTRYIFGDRSEAMRFNSEAEAADFAADHWKGFQPKVVPYQTPAETK